MPQMTGIELIRECRRLQPHLKTIVVSGTVDEKHVLGDPVKVNRFLQKPYSPTHLNATISDLLGG
jgi:YesN/AraC family two-component response regulator